MSRRMPRHGLAVALAILCAGFAAPSASAAEGERVLDLELSLTGGCGTTSVDPIPDPGLCPLESEGGPGVPGVDHPPSTFSNPKGVATDDYGNIYVSSFGGASDGSQGRIDIFCSDGTFISELVTDGPGGMAIDSDGNLYVVSTSQGKLLRFAPDAGYEPEACEIEYGETAPATVKAIAVNQSLAINRDNDHLFINSGVLEGGAIEYSSATEGNTKIITTPTMMSGDGLGIAVDAERDRMYATATDDDPNTLPGEDQIDIFDLNTVEGTAPNDQYQKIGSILPASVPAGDFGTQLSVAVNEGNGNVFVLDGENCELYEFDEDGTYLQTIDASFLQCANSERTIGVDNGPESPNGKLSDEGRYLYVPSNRTGVGHSYAFFESTVGPPEVSSIGAADISEDEAVMRAAIDPNNLPTTYTFEYKVEGAASWTPAGGGTIAGNDPVDVSAPATGLSPGTDYVFRVVANNEEAEGEAAVIAEASFTTYPSVATEPEPCANALLRTGPSALLPDCRAYELVTPANTNAHAPLGLGKVINVFTTRQVSPAGDKLPFRVEGGALPGLGGTGSLIGDPYLATRTSAGWSTTHIGLEGGAASAIVPGTTSPDQGYSFYLAGGAGPAVLGNNTIYVRYPDGHSELLGQGSLGKIDPVAIGRLISEGGGHIVFVTGVFNSSATAVRLEPNAAPDKTAAVYDRTPDGTTHVVSLKPGDVPFGAGENAEYRGASLDGVGIAFEAGNTLYLRYDNEETFEIGTDVEFAGVAEGGKRVFYLQGDNLKAFDTEEGVIDFTTTGDVTPATVAAEGTAAYFVSESVLGGANPQGDSAQAGEQNLYRSVEGQIDFVATVTERDVEGTTSGRKADGLGLWVAGVEAEGQRGMVPARSTPDGDTFLFKSRAELTEYDPEGHAQIYRWAPGELQCLSCNPTGAAASSDATLQSETREGSGELFHSVGWPENLRADGRRAFFESSEPLVAKDSDGLRDVYEWEDQGVGSCTRPEGCLYLISSPQSRRGEYLWAISPSGNDAFFLSSDLLVGSDADETPSIYDARVGGGFPEPQARAECLGEACQPSVSAPSDPIPGLQGKGNVKERPRARRCPKGKRKVRRAGRVRCLKRNGQRKRHERQRAAAERKGGKR